MDVAIWFIVLGLLFLFISLSHSWVQRVPLTTSLIYLVIGIGLGPYGIDLLTIDFHHHSKLIEHLSEVAVIISLFNAGLKLRLPLNHQFWRMPVGLAFGSMIINVALIAFVTHQFFNLHWGAAILLGAVLSPTDPVLASDVQVQDPSDHDQVRFTLTCEAGLNDGTAFPFVMLGLGLLGLGGSDWSVKEWLIFDVAWSIVGGLGVGVIVGLMLGWYEQHFRPLVRKAGILNDFLALALICLSYGIAISIKSYGFLAVFASGVIVRQLEMKVPFWKVKATFQEMSDGVLFFNEQFERLCEVAIVILLGSMLRWSHFNDETLIVGSLLMFVIRPLSVFLIGLPMKEPLGRLTFISWFGIRGIGSVYYLAFALSSGVAGALADEITGLTFSLIAISIIVHGVSVTPLMKQKWKWKV